MFEDRSLVVETEVSVSLPERQIFAADLLKSEAVRGAYQKGTETFEAIAQAGTKEEKVEAFLHSPLQVERKKVEASVFTEEERDLVDTVNTKFSENPAIQTLLFGADGWNGVLLTAIEASLVNKGVNPDVVRNELLHYQAVADLAKKFYPNNMILQMAALVHDSHKYDQNGNMKLTLHELASTLTGGQLVGEALKMAAEKGLIDLSPEEVEVITKVITRAILTHGKGEFPHLKSRPNPVAGENQEDLFWLWGQLYPVPKVHAHPEDLKQPRDTVQDVISGLNISDIFTGNDPSSFQKYNLVYSNDVLGSASLSGYLKKCIFDSYGSNFSCEAINYHLNNSPPEDFEKVVAVMRADNEQIFLLTLLLVGEQDPRYKDRAYLSEYLDFIATHPPLRDIADRVVSQHEKIAAQWQLLKPLKEQFMKTPEENGEERKALKEEIEVFDIEIVRLRIDFNRNFEKLITEIMHAYEPGVFTSITASEIQSSSLR